ncbi:anaphase-promoting complex subunit 6, partial [Tanacetum coccineum]
LTVRKLFYTHADLHHTFYTHAKLNITINVVAQCGVVWSPRLLEKDPFYLKSTRVHIAATMKIGHSNELYLMACNLVKDSPQKLLRQI